MSGPLSRRVAARCALAALLLLGPAGAAHAAWVPVTSSTPAPVQVTVRESTPERTVLEFTLPGYDREVLQVDGRSCVALTIPGEARVIAAGAPDLPVARRSVIVDDLMPVETRVLEADRVRASELRVVPSKGHLDRSMDPEKIPYRFGPAYGRDAWYPEEHAAAGDPFVVRDLRGVSVEFRPLAYNAVRGELEICRRLVIEITRGSGTAVNPLTRRPAGGDDGVFQAAYRRLFVNYDELSPLLYTPIHEPGRMVIITADQFYDQMVPLLQWKLQMGRPTTLVRYSEIGSGAAAIQAYLRSLYQSPEGLTYAVLVGDAAQIPTLYGAYEHAPSDPTYALVTADEYPDFLISRLSAQDTTQVATQVARTIHYERNPDTGAAGAWYQAATGIASNENGGTPLRDWQRMDLLRTDLLAYGYNPVDQIYDPGATRAQVTAALNAGRSLVNYIGHGSDTSWGTTGFSTTDVHNLTNGFMLPFICDVACLNGDFPYNECFAEAWLRSGTAASPKGAIAMYAASTNASWVPPCDMQTEVKNLIVSGQEHTIGGLCFSGAMKVVDLWGYPEGNILVEQYNIFGDCSLVLRTKTPTTMVVSHPASISINVPTFALDVPGVQGALAALYNGGTLYGYAYTDAAGHAVITMANPPSQAGSLTLTVTTHERVPYIAVIPVIAVQGPYLVCLHSRLDDDSAGGSSGNGDGLLDAGETAALDVTIMNQGSDPAPGATATLASSSPWITLVHAGAALGDLASGDTVAVNDSLMFMVHADAPDSQSVTLTLTMTTGTHRWSEDHVFTLHAPVLSLADMTVLDAPPGGDGDGVAEPGEAVTLRARITNSGSAAASAVVARLASRAIEWVEVTADSAGAAAIPPGGSVVLAPRYAVSIAASAPSMAQCPMGVDVAGAWGLDWYADFYLSIGGLHDNMEHGVGGWTHTVVTPGFVDQWHHTMLYNHTPGGQWSWKFGAALDGTYANHADGALVTVPLQLGPGSSLTFWHMMDADTCAGRPGYAWDGGIVEVSVSGGAWQEVAPSGGYPYRIHNGSDPGPFPEGTPCYSGTCGWEKETFDLSAVSGTAQIRFRFGSDGSVGRDGWIIDDVDVTGGQLPSTDVPSHHPPLVAAPAAMELGSARPNPFNPKTVIEYGLARDAQVDLAIYDVAGRRVRTLAAGAQGAGYHEAMWDGRDDSGNAVASGVYFYRLTGAGDTRTRSLVLMK